MGVLPYFPIRFTCRIVYVSGAYLLFGTEGDPSFTIDPLTIINTGVVGFMFLAFFTDRLFTAKAYARIIAERDKAEAGREAMTKQQFEQVLPLVQRINNVLIPLMEKVLDRLENERK